MNLKLRNSDDLILPPHVKNVILVFVKHRNDNVKWYVLELESMSTVKGSNPGFGTDLWK